MRRARRRPRAARVAYVLAALAILAAVVAPGVVTAPTSAQVSGPSVTVTPTTDIADGKQLEIVVKTDPGNTQPIYEARAYVCRAGVTYQPGDTDFPSPEGRVGGPNCPLTGLSTSAQPIAISSRTYKFAPTAEGERLYLRVGTGVVAWTDTTSGSEARLTCDQSNPCALVVQLLTDAGFQPFVFDLTFANTDAVGGCGGAAPGALVSSGSDALADAWIRWTLDSCKQGGTGAWSTFAFGEEAQAVKRFAEGQVDIAYTALGNNPEAGFVDDVPAPRGSVAVPIGISAATLAIGNGYQDADGRKLPFSSPSLTLDEATILLAGGEFPFRDLGPQIAARNPELDGLNLVMNTGTGLKIGAQAETGSNPWIFTRHFDTLRPDLWKVPDSPIFAERGQPRGVDASFPLAVPSYANVVTTLTGRPALAKAFGGLGPNDLGGIWAFTDLTTADLYDLAPVAIENASGAFVGPTTESLTAAVADMTVTDAGMRVPNPQTTTGYPMTYVVYALVPAQPLTTAEGACRSDSQELLAKWLTYVTREGQADLPEGLVALTPELQAEAETALQQVGRTPGAPCVVPGIPPAGGGAAPVPSTGSATAATSTSPSARSAATARPAASTSDAVEEANAELTVSESDTPGFLGGTLPSLLVAVAALVGIGLLTSLAARQTGRRVLPAPPDAAPPTGNGP
jgi:hypothetical protein